LQTRDNAPIVGSMTEDNTLIAHVLTVAEELARARTTTALTEAYAEAAESGVPFSYPQRLILTAAVERATSGLGIVAYAEALRAEQEGESVPGSSTEDRPPSPYLIDVDGKLDIPSSDDLSTWFEREDADPDGS
jgi:hypothetical protein